MGVISNVLPVIILHILYLSLLYTMYTWYIPPVHCVQTVDDRIFFTVVLKKKRQNFCCPILKYTLVSA